MSEYNDDIEKKERGNWVDDFSKIGETVTGLAGAIFPFFNKDGKKDGKPPKEEPIEEENTDNWNNGQGEGGQGQGGGGNDDDGKSPIGKILIYSTLGLAVIGTAVYFIVKRKK
jgi:hypothetical protein